MTLSQTDTRKTAPAGTAALPAWREAAGQRPLLVLMFGLGLLLAWRLVALLYSRTDLFFDEAQYWTWSAEPAFGYYSKPPLIAWVIGGATAVCGDGEACIRMPSALLHTFTALAIYALGTKLYDRTVGMWSALAYATLPAVSLSSGIISTDVPLLLFWALALVAFHALTETRSWWPAIGLGLCLGFGVNTKYAMAYFVPAAGLYLAMTPAHRALARDPRLWTALSIGILLLVPNVAWNLQHQFATLSHTADNANWGGKLFNPLKLLEFLASQFGVFGPVLFGGLIVILVRARPQGLAERERFLLAFTLPMLAVVTVQAFISRAHANWAALSYVAATVLVVGTFIERGAWRWLGGSFALHVVAAVAMGVGTVLAGQFTLPGGADPFSRTLGWKAMADETRAELAAARKEGHPFGAVVTDERAATAELLYYIRSEPTPVFAWRGHGKPQDHYELSRPYRQDSPGPVLLVSLRSDASEILKSFRSVEKISERNVMAGTKPRRIVYWRLKDYAPER